RWSDVAGDFTSVTIRQTRITVDHSPAYGTPKTHKPRVVDLDARTGAALRQLRAAQAAERLLFGPGYDDADLVFALPDGRPY
ncbi:hypothetical protein ACKI1Z_43000, partial [Streptomyces galilaeus]|uniref:hypothetical protein n=1 Tax=Streptomyces galilaeus TaxID=33899 RepID=UPI0038F7506A